jgi:thioredoxin-related protein
MAPEVARLVAAHEGELAFEKVYAEDNADRSVVSPEEQEAHDKEDDRIRRFFDKYKITSVPALVFLNQQGTLVMRAIGAMKLAELERVFKLVKKSAVTMKKTDSVKPSKSKKR